MAEEDEWQSKTISFVTMAEVETKIAEAIAANGGGGSGGGDILLASTYNKDSEGGILICSQYNP